MVQPTPTQKALERALGGAYDNTREAMQGLLEELCQVQEGDLIAMIENKEVDEEVKTAQMKEDDPIDNILIGLLAATPLGSVRGALRPRIVSAGVQTGVSGRPVAQFWQTRWPQMLERCCGIQKSLLRAVNADSDLTSPLLNHLVTVAHRAGHPIAVPEGATIEELPLPLMHKKRQILVGSQIEAYPSTAHLLQKTYLRYWDREERAWQAAGHRRNEGNLVVDTMLRDFVALLDQGICKDKEDTEGLRYEDHEQFNAQQASGGVLDWGTPG